MVIVPSSAVESMNLGGIVGMTSLAKRHDQVRHRLCTRSRRGTLERKKALFWAENSSSLTPQCARVSLRTWSRV